MSIMPAGGNGQRHLLTETVLLSKVFRCDIIQDIITFHGPEATTEANKERLEIWAAAAIRKYFYRRRMDECYEEGLCHGYQTQLFWSSM